MQKALTSVSGAPPMHHQKLPEGKRGRGGECQPLSPCDLQEQGFVLTVPPLPSPSCVLSGQCPDWMERQESPSLQRLGFSKWVSLQTDRWLAHLVPRDPLRAPGCPSLRLSPGYICLCLSLSGPGCGARSHPGWFQPLSDHRSPGAFLWV